MAWLPLGRAEDRAGVVERQARRTRRRWHIRVAEIDQEIRFPGAIGKEYLVNPRGIEPRHRTAIQAKRACREDEIGALQGGVAQGRFAGQQRVAGEPGTGLGMREELG